MNNLIQDENVNLKEYLAKALSKKKHYSAIGSLIYLYPDLDENIFIEELYDKKMLSYIRDGLGQGSFSNFKEINKWIFSRISGSDNKIGRKISNTFDIRIIDLLLSSHSFYWNDFNGAPSLALLGNVMKGLSASEREEIRNRPQFFLGEDESASLYIFDDKKMAISCIGMYIAKHINKTKMHLSSDINIQERLNKNLTPLIKKYNIKFNNFDIQRLLFDLYSVKAKIVRKIINNINEEPFQENILNQIYQIMIDKDSIESAYNKVVYRVNSNPDKDIFDINKIFSEAIEISKNENISDHVIDFSRWLLTSFHFYASTADNYGTGKSKEFCLKLGGFFNQLGEEISKINDESLGYQKEMAKHAITAIRCWLGVGGNEAAYERNVRTFRCKDNYLKFLEGFKGELNSPKLSSLEKHPVCLFNYHKKNEDTIYAKVFIDFFEKKDFAPEKIFHFLNLGYINSLVANKMLNDLRGISEESLRSILEHTSLLDFSIYIFSKIMQDMNDCFAKNNIFKRKYIHTTSDVEAIIRSVPANKKESFLGFLSSLNDLITDKNFLIQYQNLKRKPCDDLNGIIGNYSSIFMEKIIKHKLNLDNPDNNHHQDLRRLKI